MTFGERLTILRKRKGWTQEDVAKKLNISRSAYAGYEIDRRVPEYATLEKIADIFDVSIDYLTGRDKKGIIEDVIDLTDDKIIDKPMFFNGRELSKEKKEKVIRILREVVRIETREDP